MTAAAIAGLLHARRTGPMDGAMSTSPKNIVEMTRPAPVGRATTPIVLVEAE
jgi:hypothetical protein